jgi:hypothetical protein
VTSARFRRIGRLFAVLLLAWTAADICDFGLCRHDREPIAPAVPAGPHGARTVTAWAPDTGAPSDAADLGEDCFCCSPYVDVQTRVAITVTYSFAWKVAFDLAARPDVAASRLYHPPLA